MGLDGGLELRETLAISVQAFKIRVVQRPQQELWGRHGTLRTQRRIDAGIKGNQDIELRQRDLTEVPGPMGREVDPKCSCMTAIASGVAGYPAAVIPTLSACTRAPSMAAAIPAARGLRHIFPTQTKSSCTGRGIIASSMVLCGSSRQTKLLISPCQ